MIAAFHANALTMTLLLLFGHCLADFALQNDYIAKMKHPDQGGDIWPLIMSAHSMMHAGFVLLFTGDPHLAVLEFIAHAYIDYGKCKGYISYKTDQFLHIFCKLAYVQGLIWVYGLSG